MSGAVVFIPLIGGLMDGYGYPITMLVTIFFGIVWSILLATADAYYLYASFLFYAMFRTFLYTFLFSYLADKLGFKYYGILAGVLFFVSGLFGLLQYPLSLFAAGACIYPVPATGESCSHGLWTPLNHLMTVMFIALLYFPYQDYQERQVLARVSSFRSISSYISPSNFSK
jgi:MFS family permease